MVPARIRTITTATYEAVDTDQEFTLSELEDVLHRLKDAAPGDDTNDQERTTGYQTPLPQTHQPIIHMGELPTLWKWPRLYRSPRKTKRIVPFGSKRHSLQAVELSQRTQAAVQIVSNLPAPINGGPIYRFLGHAGHADPLDGWRCCSQKRVMSRPIQVRQL